MRGLYRALRLKTADTSIKVKPFRGTLDDLRRAVKSGPLILSVRLTPGPGIDPRFQNEWGWDPGVGHHVVVFGQRDDGLFEVGDPSVGRELWDDRAFRTLWKGQAIQLVFR